MLSELSGGESGHLGQAPFLEVGPLVEEGVQALIQAVELVVEVGDHLRLVLIELGVGEAFVEGFLVGLGEGDLLFQGLEALLFAVGVAPGGLGGGTTELVSPRNPRSRGTYVIMDRFGYKIALGANIC